MDKKARMEKLARDAYEKGGFNGTWLYAENGRKRGMLKLKFGDGCLKFDDITCKKLQA